MKTIKHYLRLFYDIYLRQFRLIIHDQGLIVFFLFLPFAYPVIYSLIYNPELVREVTVVVVDHDRTPASRLLVRRFDATQGARVIGYAADLNEARRAMNEHKCYGIFEIPAGYGRKIGRGEQGPAVLYCEMSLLLRYKALLMSATDVQLALGAQIQAQNIAAEIPMGASYSVGDPMPIENIDLGDTTGGFDSFIMPGVIIFILHQCIILSVGMMGGAYRERPELYFMNPFEKPHPIVWSMLARVLVVITVLAAPMCFLVHYIPLIFHFPMSGNSFQILAFLLPMVIGCCFIGDCLQGIVRQREDIFIIWVATSLMLVFLSGLTWPRFAMTDFWRAVGDLFPATWGMEGFVRMNSNGASLNQVSHCYAMLWILAGIYGVLAYVTQRWCVVPDIRLGLKKRALIMAARNENRKQKDRDGVIVYKQQDMTMKTLRIFSVALLGGAMVLIAACSQKASDKAVTAETENTPPVVAQDSVEKVVEPAATATDITALFQDNVGKNARDIGFFDNAVLKAQLIALMGPDKFTAMKDDWQTQVPIQEINGCYVTGGMKDNSGANPGFTIVYNPKIRNLSVAWVQNGKTEVFQQQKEDITSLIQFPAN